METALPALLLFLVVLVRLSMFARRQPPQTTEGPRILCRLHRWERTEDGIVCRECGMHPTVD